MSGLTSLPTRTAGSLSTMKFDAEPIAEDKVDQHILAAEHNVAMEALGWLNGSATYSNGDPRPVYAVHLMLEALDAATCLARSQQILGINTP